MWSGSALSSLSASLWGGGGLALELARQWQWPSPSGQLKRRSGLAVLVELERRDALQLPATKRGLGPRTFRFHTVTGIAFGQHRHRRRPGRSKSGWPTPKVHVKQDLLDDIGIIDNGDQPHLLLTDGTLERVRMPSLPDEVPPLPSGKLNSCF